MLLHEESACMDQQGVEHADGGSEERLLARFVERLHWARMYSSEAVALAMQSIGSDPTALASTFHARHFLVTQLLKVRACQISHHCMASPCR